MTHGFASLHQVLKDRQPVFAGRSARGCDAVVTARAFYYILPAGGTRDCILASQILTCLKHVYGNPRRRSFATMWRSAEATAETITLSTDGTNINVNVDPTATVAGTISPGPVMSSFPLSAVTSITVQARNGTETINLESTAVPVTVNLGIGTDTVNLCPTAKDLSAIAGSETITGGGGHDLVSLYDQAYQFFSINTITTSSFQNSHAAPITFSAMAGLTFNMSNHGGFTDVESTAAATPVTVNAGSGIDSIALSNTANNLDTIQGAVTVNGGGGQANLGIHDEKYQFFSINTITSQGFSSSHAAGVTFTGLASLTFGMSSTADGFTDVESTAAGTPAGVDAGAGFDDIALSNTANNLDAIQGAVTVRGGGAGTTLSLNDQAGPATSRYVLTASGLTRSNFGGLTYSGIANLNVNGGPGNSLGNYQTTQNIYVLGTAAGVTTTIDATNGWHDISVGLPTDPRINTTGLPGTPLDNIQGPLTIKGQGGRDIVNL
jgi:hypothetical protein